MDVRHLKYFVAVAKSRSFTKASEQLHVTQPTLSKMVRLLEEELNVPLFERGGSKQIQLTDAGEVIFRSAQRVLASIDHMTTELDDLLMLHRGRLRLGLPPMIGWHYFPRILEHYHERYPNIRIHLAEQGGKRIEANVESGELDVGIVVLPIVDEPLFTVQPFLEDRLRVVVHPDHPLAARSHIELRELAGEPLILFGEEFTLHHLMKDACLKEGFTPNIVLETSQWDFMTGMVVSRFGIAFLPENICRTLDPSKVRTIPLTSPGISWRLAMIWRKNAYISNAARAWIDLLKDWDFRS